MRWRREWSPADPPVARWRIGLIARVVCSALAKAPLGYCAIPAGARAVAFTITVTGTGAAGYVAVLPGTTTTVSASTINWSGPGATIAAGGIVSLGSGADERKVTLVVGGGCTASSDVIVDITGYYQ